MTDQLTTNPRSAKRPSAPDEQGGRTLATLAASAGARYGGAALRHKSADGWEDISYPQLAEIASEIARGLIALGIERGERVAILSNTRPEWTLADLGSLAAGATVAPIYQTNSPEECAYVLTHSEARLVFCEDADQLAKIAAIREQCPALEHVVAFDGRIDGSISLDELRALGSSVSETALERRTASVRPEEVATLVYTSGTTGPPKGCMLSHANLLATIDMYLLRIRFDETHTVFMFLPLAHVLARMAQMASIEAGATIAYWERDPAKILDNLAETRPSHFPSVPRVFEKIYTAASSGLEDQRAVKRALVHWSLDSGRRARDAQRAGKKLGPLARRRYRLADRLVLSKVRALFGGRLQLALTGAAPIAPDVLEFFDSCGIPVLEGYGMTESCAASTLNTEDDRRFGTVGKPLPGTEVRIADDGEILMHGPHVFVGYFKDPEATSATMADGGWLRTGDLGRVDESGFVSITGRKKEIIITSSGKNITPTNIENSLKEHRWISEAVVYGDGRPYLVALITLDPDEAPALAARLGVEADPAAMAHEPLVQAEIQKAVDEVNSHVARIEQVKRFAILEAELSQAAGELTPTLKVKRNVVYDHYADTIDALYAGEREAA
jgi:long-chain acyl-CoA synthetase